MVRFFQAGFGNALSAAGLMKTSARAMDKYLEMVPMDTDKPEWGGNWTFRFKGKRVGGIKMNPASGQMSLSGLDESPFRGMGLGKKMYGRLMQRLPEGTLLSDDYLSPYSARVYERMRADPSYQTWKHPTIQPGGYNIALQQAQQDVAEESQRAANEAARSGRLRELGQTREQFEAAYREKRMPEVEAQQMFPEGVKDLPATPENLRRYGADVPYTSGTSLPAYAVSLPEKALIPPSAQDPEWLRLMFEGETSMPAQSRAVEEQMRALGKGEMWEQMSTPERRALMRGSQRGLGPDFAQTVEQWGGATDIPEPPTPRGALSPQQVQEAATEAPGVDPALWERKKVYSEQKRRAAFPGMSALTELAYPGTAVAGAAKPSSFVSRLRGLVT